MELNKETALIEAILFLESESLSLKKLTSISKLPPTAVEQSVKLLRQKYQDDLQHGLCLVEIADGVMLAPKDYLWPFLKERYGSRNEAVISRAARETLAIIAYSQPITRTEIEAIRGVNSDSSIRQLLKLELIKVVGKKEVFGRPSQYGTSREFLKRFGLKSIADLPRLKESDERKFKTNESENENKNE